MTIYLDVDLEVRLKLEAMRRKQPMAELLREALRSYISNVPQKLPPGAGAFDSGRADTANRHEEVLGQGLVAAYREMAADELERGTCGSDDDEMLGPGAGNR
jgi:hypothetical protein